MREGQGGGKYGAVTANARFSLDVAVARAMRKVRGTVGGKGEVREVEGGLVAAVLCFSPDVGCGNLLGLMLGLRFGYRPFLSTTLAEHATQGFITLDDAQHDYLMALIGACICIMPTCLCCHPP